MNKKMIIPGVAAMLAFVVSSCAPSTPATRIKKSPTVFQQLSPSDQQLAQQGQVEEGMEKNAVLIAWGSPSSVSAGSRDGVRFEKWYYTTARPVYSSSVNIGFGYGGYGRRGFGRRGFGRFGGYGGYGGFGGYGGYSGYGLGTTYVRSVSAVVEFDSSGRVANWSRSR